MDDLRLLQEMRADAPLPDEARLAGVRAMISEGMARQGLTTTTQPREALAAGALASRGSVQGTAARRVPRRFVKLAAALSGVGAAVAAAVLINGAASPAFAVTPRADGSIEVFISDFSDSGGLEEALAAEGVRASVDYLPEGKTCKEPRGEHAAVGRMKTGLGARDGGVAFTITRGAVGSDETLVLAVSGGGDGKMPSALQLTVIKGEPNECVPVPVPEPGSHDGDGPSEVTRRVIQGDGDGHRGAPDGEKSLHQAE
jgi:hypothetical protein